MATIVTRSGKGSPLTNTEVDANFTNLNSDKLETSAAYTNANAVAAVVASDLDMGGNKVLFGNVYSALVDLPSASTYHGMFAHVHATGLAYYAHSGAWVPLARSSDVYTHPNHTGEVTSTSDGATVIADNIVDEANLKVSNTPTNGYVLTAQSGNTGGLTWDSGLSEESTTITSSSNAATLNLNNGPNFVHDLTENVTYTFSNPAASGKVSSFTLKVIQDSTARTITWPSSVDWAAATAPTLTATNNGVDIFVFFTNDGGTTYYGFTAGQAMA